MIILNRIIWILNLIAGIALLLSYASPYVSPMIWWIAAFFGLAFPLLFILNAVFLMYWLILGKLKLVFPLICILVGFNHFGKVYKLSGNEASREEEDIVLLSMNVKYFGQTDGNIFIDSLSSYLAGIKPEIICFQEYVEYPVYKGKSSLKTLRKACGINYHLIQGKDKGAPDKGVVILSKYKPLQTGYVSFGTGNVNGAIWADIVLPGKDTIRVYSCHLQSNNLSKKEQFHQKDVQNQEVAVKKSKSIIKRLKLGFELRSEQVALVSEHMEKSPYPILLAGDMNDTQLSYTYRQMRGEKRDAFVESGKGSGNTYVGPFPSYRIDYIFHDASLRSFNYKNGPHYESDHKLIQALIKH